MLNKETKRHNGLNIQNIGHNQKFRSGEKKKKRKENNYVCNDLKIMSIAGVRVNLQSIFNIVHTIVKNNIVQKEVPFWIVKYMCAFVLEGESVGPLVWG